MERAAPVIELCEIGKTYEGEPSVVALDRCNLTVRQGEMVAVVGDSGSGKSTLLNILGLLDRASRGHYRLNGIEVANLSRKTQAEVRGSKIGFVFQSFQLISGRSAIENVALALTYKGETMRSSGPLAEQSLRRVGMGHRLHSKPETLSGGERQRVAIARAILGNPSVLLCDEPTGNLDSRNADEITQILKQLNADGTTVVMITHNDKLADIAPRKAIMRDGYLCEA